MLPLRSVQEISINLIEIKSIFIELYSRFKYKLQNLYLDQHINRGSISYLFYFQLLE